ncbi:hypothetical protein HAX54_013005, partial [Datura stramonium]|nr:hypothetical protein [Datura stramonium]
MVNLAQVLGFLIIGIVTSVGSSAEEQQVVTYVFGDSLTEVGNNNYLPSLAKSNYPFYGIDYEGGMATGRFTNGRTIAAKLGIESPPPFLSLGPNDDAILKGVNYASGGAGILNDTGLYFIQRMTFDDQIKSFEETKEAIKAKIGQEAAEEHVNEAIYFIGMGSNDYVNNFLQPFFAFGQQYTHDEFVELLTSTLGEQFTRLHQLGARKMVFHGLGPLGCIPSQRVKSTEGMCLEQVNLWVQEFNSKVKNLIDDLNKHLQYAQITFADTYPIVLDLIENPTAYGFKISNASCCNVDTIVGGLCLPSSNLCENRTEYVFWDAFHPTDAANVVLADSIFAGLSYETYNPASAPAPAPQKYLSEASSPAPTPQ